MQVNNSNQQLIATRSKEGIAMSIINAAKQEKKRSQSTRSRSNPRQQLLNINEFGQQGQFLLNQTSDNNLVQYEYSQPQHFLIPNSEQGNRRVIISSKYGKRQENSVIHTEQYSSNMEYQQINNQAVNMQRYFSEQSPNDEDLPLPFFPTPYHNNQEDQYDMDAYNGQMNHFLTQNQIVSALETPKFNFTPISNAHASHFSNQVGFDVNEGCSLQFEILQNHQESPQQISVNHKINSRRNEFFSFGKSRSSLSQQKLGKMSHDNLSNIHKIDDELFENENFANIVINNSNLPPPIPPKQSTKITSKSPTSFLLSEISQNLSSPNDQNAALATTNKLLNTINLQKQNKQVIPFKVKNIPKGNSVLKMQLVNQTKMTASPLNGYTFYNYIDKENYQIQLPKSDSIQFRNTNKSPIQASHTLQLNQNPSTKNAKQSLTPPPSQTLSSSSQQKMGGSLHIRPIIQSKQTKTNSVHMKPLQNLNDSFNGTSSNKFTRKMIQNQSFDNIQQSLIQPINSNPHKRSQDSKNSHHVGGQNTLTNQNNQNNSFEIGSRFAIEAFLVKENSLKLSSKPNIPSPITNKQQRQLSAKKPIKQGSSQSFHQRMKTIM